MTFFATRFSRILSGLLILATGSSGQCANILRTNNIKEDNMPVARNEVPNENRWNVEALYLDPESWKAELKQAQGQASTPKWPHLSAHKGQLHDPKSAL